MPKPLTSAPASTSASTPVQIVGESSKRLWGLKLSEWQRRAYNKVVSANKGSDIGGQLTADVNWVLSANTQKSLAGSANTALTVDERIIAVNAPGNLENSENSENIGAQTLIGKPAAAAKKYGLKPKSLEALTDGYIKALRKKEKPYALNALETPMSEIEKRQFDSSYKGITDFVTKFVWPLPALYATRFCAKLKITPNMVTTLSLVMVIAATYFFSQGAWLAGFAAGWFMTFLDTVDGKLARTTMTYSKWGNVYDHGIDLIHPPFWYIAWFMGLGGALIGGSALKFALIAILIGYVVDRLVEGAFIHRFGFHIHVWKPFNSALRFIIARRNPNTFIFMIGIIASLLIPGAAQIGFIAVAVWVWVCISANLASLAIASLAKTPIRSWMEEPQS